MKCGRLTVSNHTRHGRSVHLARDHTVPVIWMQTDNTKGRPSPCHLLDNVVFTYRDKSEISFSQTAICKSQLTHTPPRSNAGAGGSQPPNAPILPPERACSEPGAVKVGSSGGQVLAGVPEMGLLWHT